MKKYKDNLILTFGLIMGGLLIRLYNDKKKLQTVVETQEVANEVTNAVMDFKAQYFKDSEYFKGLPIPQNYYQNWKQLSMVLDKIRKAFGGPVTIIKGYEQPTNGVITNNFNLCRQAWVFPVAGYNSVSHLKDVVSTLVNSGVISVSEWKLNDNKTISITI